MNHDNTPAATKARRQQQNDMQRALTQIATLTDLMSRATPGEPDTGTWSGAIDDANNFIAGSKPGPVTP